MKLDFLVFVVIGRSRFVSFTPGFLHFYCLSTKWSDSPGSLHTTGSYVASEKKTKATFWKIKKAAVLFLSNSRTYSCSQVNIRKINTSFSVWGWNLVGCISFHEQFGTVDNQNKERLFKVLSELSVLTWAILIWCQIDTQANIQNSIKMVFMQWKISLHISKSTPRAWIESVALSLPHRCSNSELPWRRLSNALLS